LQVKLTKQQLLQLYMVTGGIPYYLMNIKPGESAVQIIERLAFRENALLLNEFDNLMASLFDHHELCVKIIRFVASFHEGVAREDVFKHIGKEYKGKLGLKLLRSLEDTGFLICFKPYQRKKKGLYYRVIDEYTLFYFYWIEPVKDVLMTQNFDEGYWLIQQKTPSWQSWSGNAFESICYKHIVQIKKALKLLPVDLPYTWRYQARPKSDEQGAQIDLLFDRQDDSITLCEIKYTNQPFVIDKSYAKKLLNKKNVFQQKTATGKQIFLVVISANGVKNNFYAEDLLSGVVKLEALFAG